MGKIHQTWSHFSNQICLWSLPEASCSEWNFKTSSGQERRVTEQCDQIGQFIALWATFLTLWQHIFCPNRHIFRQFLKVSKSFILLVKSFWPTFYRHLAIIFYWSHWHWQETKRRNTDDTKSRRLPRRTTNTNGCQLNRERWELTAATTARGWCCRRERDRHIISPAWPWSWDKFSARPIRRAKGICVSQSDLRKPWERRSLDF